MEFILLAAVVMVSPTAAAERSVRAQPGTKIPLTQHNVIDGWCAPNGGGAELDVVYNLLDEQELVGDPRAGDDKTPQTFWFPGYVKW